MTELLSGPWQRDEHSTVIRVTSPEQPHHAFAMLYLKTGGRGGKPCPRMRATALAMLAAPELLAALKRLATETAAHLDYHDDETMQGAHDAALAAIAAAEGREG